MSHKVGIRPATPEDRELFYELRHDGFRTYAEAVFGPWDETRQRASAARDLDELPVEIIEYDGDPVGYQILLRHPDHWFLDEIAIAAAERNRGLGTQLVSMIMTAARALDLPLRLSVLHVNPAQRLYARLGFRITRVEHPRIKMEWP